MLNKVLLILTIVFGGTISIGCSHASTTDAAPVSAAGQQNQPQIIELAVGENDTYLWRGRSWQTAELQGALQSENSRVRVSEIRLLSGSHPSTMQNVIEIGQVAKAVGAKAFYERKGEWKSISIVE